jgi:hypothetical protein
MVGRYVAVVVVVIGTACRGSASGASDAQPLDALVACPGTDAAYTACGCGCCPGAPSSIRCLDSAHGETLDSVEQADRLTASNPKCPQIGCGAPIVYVCCE